MTATLRGSQVATYEDDNGNTIVGAPRTNAGSTVEFHGRNCGVVFGENVKFEGTISFRAEGSVVHIGDRSSFRGRMTLGRGCNISMGDGIYCGRDLRMTTAEGQNILLGDDLLIADDCRIRADDSHPIYDGVTGERINHSASIVVGDHVWIGQEVLLMPGAAVSTGSVVGARSMVTKSSPIPPYCLALGSPARVHRERVNWVRKHLQVDEIAEDVPSIFEPQQISDSSSKGSRSGVLGGLFRQG